MFTMLRRNAGRNGRRLLAAALAATFFPSLASAQLVHADAEAQISLVPMRDAYDALSDSQNILLVTSSLQKNSVMVKRLKEAVRGGATVSVGIDAPEDAVTGASHDARRARNETNDVAADLALQGARVRWVAPAHVAVMVLDRVLFVSNHDWPAAIPDDQDVIADTVRYHRALIAQAFTNVRTADHDDRLWMRKSTALNAEAGIIAARTSAEVDVMTTEIDARSTVYEAIERRANDEDRPRLLIAKGPYDASPQERSAIAELQRRGADVRVGDPPENLAIEGYDVWYGSEAATLTDIEGGSPKSAPTDVAFALRSPNLAARLHADFVAAWNKASPVAVPSPRHALFGEKPDLRL